METTREKLRKYYEKNAFTKNTMFGFDDVVKFAEIHANDVTTSQQQTIERLRGALKWFTDFPKEDLQEWIKEGKPITITVPVKAFEQAEQLLNTTEPIDQ